ncbi:MAG: DUF3592 domain-containing protein [Rhizobacter sp.]
MAILVACAGVVYVGGGLLVYTQVPPILEGWRSRDWPSTQGTVESAQAVHRYGRTQNRQFSGNQTHVIELRYAFDIEGRRYTGTRRSLDDEGKVSTPESAQMQVAAYPVGRVLTVWYDPQDPKRSLTAPGLPLGAVMMASFGLCLLAFGCLPVLYVLRKRHAAAKQARAIAARRARY